jgi:hypothetical protein
MDSVVIFLAGYSLGAKAGAKGYAEFVRSVKAVKESEEFRAMLRALRSHVAHTLREAAELLGGTEPVAMGDVLQRARRLAGDVDGRSKSPGPAAASATG